jgi:hypothetical protein
MSVCPHFESCTGGSDCTSWGSVPDARCEDPEYNHFHLRGQPGDPCSGWRTPTTPAANAHLECIYCGSEEPSYYGHEGDPCVGYSQWEGKRVDGTLYMCR